MIMLQRHFPNATGTFEGYSWRQRIGSLTMQRLWIQRYQQIYDERLSGHVYVRRSPVYSMLLNDLLSLLQSKRDAHAQCLAYHTAMAAR